MSRHLVTQRGKLIGEVREQAWALYAESFTELNKHTAQNHMMNRRDFDAMCDDERIVKHIATGPDGGIAGLSTMIAGTDLEAWPLASIPYFQTHWAEYFPTRLWYLGFICAQEGRRKSGIFRDMLEDMSANARLRGGVVFADFAEVNKHLPRGSHHANLTVDAGTWFDRVDSQSYYVFGFTKGAA